MPLTSLLGTHDLFPPVNLPCSPLLPPSARNPPLLPRPPPTTLSPGPWCPVHLLGCSSCHEAHVRFILSLSFSRLTTVGPWHSSVTHPLTWMVDVFIMLYPPCFLLHAAASISHVTAIPLPYLASFPCTIVNARPHLLVLHCLSTPPP